ncbi:two-component response regulator ARR11 [Striga asiatica]|uniref:Two-component response regulator ARR11 n=1 Tax=Striga asiatica TaxID=4170 RepID=A0A5A7RH23_STRAF|nr:two-component response regulator ARR11 [Striga asiatica]
MAGSLPNKKKKGAKLLDPLPLKKQKAEFSFDLDGSCEPEELQESDVEEHDNATLLQKCRYDPFAHDILLRSEDEDDKEEEAGAGAGAVAGAGADSYSNSDVSDIEMRARALDEERWVFFADVGVFSAGLRVLVVDGDPTRLKILEKMLKKCNYEENEVSARGKWKKIEKVPFPSSASAISGFHYNFWVFKLAQHIDEGNEDGLYISSVASSSNLWALVMDAGTGFSSQVYEFSPYCLHKSWVYYEEPDVQATASVRAFLFERL